MLALTHSEVPPCAEVVGAINEARKFGVGIPMELSVVGFDDAELRFGVSPEMTSVCQDAVQLGREAFNSLNRILNHQEDGKSSPLKQELRTWLEIHETTGKPPARAVRISMSGQQPNSPHRPQSGVCGAAATEA